jgi:hypothetical protein
MSEISRSKYKSVEDLREDTGGNERGRAAVKAIDDSRKNKYSRKDSKKTKKSKIRVRQPIEE